MSFTSWFFSTSLPPSPAFRISESGVIIYLFAVTLTPCFPESLSSMIKSLQLLILDHILSPSTAEHLICCFPHPGLAYSSLPSFVFILVPTEDCLLSGHNDLSNTQIKSSNSFAPNFPVASLKQILTLILFHKVFHYLAPAYPSDFISHLFLPTP